MKLSKYEQETIINYNREGKEAEICTADPVVIAKLEKLMKKYPKSYIFISHDAEYLTVKCSKRLIRFGAPCTKQYSEEEKEKLREQLRSIKK